MLSEGETEGHKLLSGFFVFQERSQAAAPASSSTASAKESVAGYRSGRMPSRPLIPHYLSSTSLQSPPALLPAILHLAVCPPRHGFQRHLRHIRRLQSSLQIFTMPSLLPMLVFWQHTKNFLFQPHLLSFPTDRCIAESILSPQLLLRRIHHFLFQPRHPSFPTDRCIAESVLPPTFPLHFLRLLHHLRVSILLAVAALAVCVSCPTPTTMLLCSLPHPCLLLLPSCLMVRHPAVCLVSLLMSMLFLLFLLQLIRQTWQSSSASLVVSSAPMRNVFLTRAALKAGNRRRSASKRKSIGLSTLTRSL